MLTVGLMALLVAVVSGQDKDKKKEKPKVGADPLGFVFSFPKSITLDDKQKEKVEALKKEFGPKLTELTKKREAIFTAERMKAAKEAAKDKKGKEAFEAFMKGMKLTPEEEKKMKEITAEQFKLFKEIQTKKMDLLTDAQKEALKKKPSTTPKKDKDK
jgi:hypothetical protein